MKLDFSVESSLPIDRTDSQAVIVLIPDYIKKQTALKSISTDIYAHIEAAMNDGDFKPSAGYCLLLRGLSLLKAPRLLLIGVGKACQKDLQKAMDSMVQEFEKYNVKKATISLNLIPDADERLIEAVVINAIGSSYEYNFTKNKPSKGKENIKIKLSGADTTILKNSLKRGLGIAEGVALARELGNRPANYVTPTYLATTAKTLSKEYKNISNQTLGLKEVEKLGMGAFISVAQGSVQPLKFIILKYQGAASSEASVVLVGKGITFDSGGISLKPGAGMDEMKFDMCGAASVLGVFAALGKLQPKINVVGLIASCENLPSGTATKPGDVVTSMSGQTIEVLNTDAEGRLILCDALTYAKRFKPQAVVDIATLTGACVVALGHVNSGLFSNNQDLQHELYLAGNQAADPCWPMPMDEAYAESLKSNFADVANVGGREAGAVTAAMFLKRFAEDYQWAHLDIAGTAWVSGKKKGATGRPVPLLINFLLNRVAKIKNVPKKSTKVDAKKHQKKAA